MPTLLGAAVGSTAGVVVNRSAVAGSRIASEEAKIRTDSGVSTFTYGANRQHYRSVTEAFAPASEAGGTLADDAAAGRLPIVSMKVDALGTWAQAAVASPTVNVTLYNAIVAFANGAKAWWNIYHDSFVFTLHHEGNDADVTNAAISGSTVLATGIANWQAAMQNIMAIFVARGVPMWTGTSDGLTTEHGCMPVMILAAGETSGHKDDFNLWWAPSWTWGNNNLVGAWADAYNKEPVFKAFSYIFSTYKTWTDAKRTSQAALGKTFLAGIAETGCAEFSEYTSTHSSWTATGLAATKANWFINMAAYVRTSWPLLYAVCLYDSQKAGVGETPWMLDTSAGSWAGWITTTQDAAWEKIITLPAGTTTWTVTTDIPFGTTLRMDPHNTGTLVMDNKNLVIHGRLFLHPIASATQIVRHINVNEAAFVGAPTPNMTDNMGSMTAVATDIGGWVFDHGKLDLYGTPKVGWNRTGDDASWVVGDDMKTVPFAALDYTTFNSHTKGGALLSVDPGNGVTYTQEAINLTRNVRFEGTSGHKSHWLIMTPDVAQVIKYASTQFLGPRKLDANGESAKIRGRWSGFHFHHLMDSVGSLQEGVVVRDGGGHAYVAHDSHFVTFRDCIAYRSFNDSYWWDNETGSGDFRGVFFPDQLSLGVRYEHCMAAATLVGEAEGSASLTGFLLHAFSGVAIDCVAVGNQGTSTAAGFTWPEFGQSTWENLNNVSHNNAGRGVYAWQNTGQHHELFGMVCFRNGLGGITNGAYTNNYHHNDEVCFQNAGGGHFDFDAHAAGHNGAGPNYHQVVQDGWYGDVGVLYHVTAPSDSNNAVYRNNHLGHVTINELRTGGSATSGAFKHGNFDFVENDCDEPEDFCNLAHPHAGNHISTYIYNSGRAAKWDQLPSIMRVQRADGTAFRLQQVGTSNTEWTAATIPAFAFSVLPQTLPQAAQGVAYSQTVQKGFGQAPITWTLATGSGPLPAGLALSAAGVISGTPTATGTYPITVEATDISTQHARRTLSLLVTASANLQITTSSLPGGVLNDSYSASLTATGGVGPYTFALTAGSLPPGLSVSSAGVISGTPTTVGTYTPTFRATDSTSATSPPRQLSIAVLDLSPTFVTASLAPGEQGLAYSQTIVAQDGTPPYTFVVLIGPLPPGLALSSAGVLSGTPTAFADYPVRIRVTDAASRSATRDYSITTYQALDFPTPSLPIASVGQFFLAGLTVTGGAPPVDFTGAGDLPPVGMPPGLVLADDGVISGFPTTEGSFSFDVVVTDDLTVTTSQTCQIEVVAAEVSTAMDRRKPNAFVLRHPLGGSYVRDKDPVPS